MGEWQESEGRIEPSDFERFFARSERPVRFALSSRFGFEVGREATAEAMTYAWEHWDRVSGMNNPAGYVYRVGQRMARRMGSRFEPVDFFRIESQSPVIEPKLAPALSGLSARQRQAVVLVHALGWTHQETADFLGVTTSSVQRHVKRGMERLRRVLGVDVEP
jgi:RNA polymerase sigma-70 factor (ECF subfamily)